MMLVHSVDRMPPQQQTESEALPFRTKMRRPSVPVNSACSHCRRLHARCEDQRPCRRCIASGRGMDCFDPEHKKRGRPRIYDVNINKPTFEIAPKSDPRNAPTQQPQYASYPPQHPPSRFDKPMLLPVPLRRDSMSQSHRRDSSAQFLRRDSFSSQFMRRDSSSSQASSNNTSCARPSMLPGAGTPPDTPSFPVWRNPFASDGNKWIFPEASSREGEGRLLAPPPDAKKGRCLSIDELLS